VLTPAYKLLKLAARFFIAVHIIVQICDICTFYYEKKIFAIYFCQANKSYNCWYNILYHVQSI